MAKYLVLEPIWSLEYEHYFFPGDVVELSGDMTYLEENGILEPVQDDKDDQPEAE